MRARTTQLTGPNERQICQQIVNAINASGVGYVWRVNAGMLPQRDRYGKQRMIRMAAAGQSDIQGLTRDGRFIALEVKKPTTRKRVTVKQNEFLERIQEMGGIASVVTSAEEALFLLDEIGNQMDLYMKAIDEIKQTMGEDFYTLTVDEVKDRCKKRVLTIKRNKIKELLEMLEQQRWREITMLPR